MLEFKPSFSEKVSYFTQQLYKIIWEGKCITSPFSFKRIKERKILYFIFSTAKVKDAWTMDRISELAICYSLVTIHGEYTYFGFRHVRHPDYLFLFNVTKKIIKIKKDKKVIIIIDGSSVYYEERFTLEYIIEQFYAKILSHKIYLKRNGKIKGQRIRNE